MEISCLILLVATIELTHSTVQIPSDIRRCTFSDAKCIASSMNYVLKRYGRIGISEMNLPPLGAAKIDDVEVVEDDMSKVIWYQVQAKNVMVYGLENTTITKIKTDWQLKSIDIYGIMPNLVAKMDYTMKTRILSFALQTTGHGSVAVRNLRFVSRSSFILDNRGYVRIYRLAVNTKIERPIFDLTNVNEDNTDLAIVLNEVLNDNWQDVWAEIMPVFEIMLRDNFIKSANQIFSTVTYKNLFLPEEE